METRLETNFNDIKLLFASNGTTDAGTLEYIDHTRDTEPEEYAVYISQAATQGSETGNTDLSGTLSVATDKVLSITEGGKTATITLTNGMSLSTIVSEINTDLDTIYTETLVGANLLYEGSGESTAITSNTTWDEVYVGANSANLALNDEIHFQGTTRSGSSISGYYKIENLSTGKVQGLLSAIELAYENDIIASINDDGKIVVEDLVSGDGSLVVNLYYNNEGDDSDLDMGTIDQQTTRDLDLGLINWTNSGLNVAGTIGGEEATGAGQILTGNEDEANVDGLSVKYTGTTEDTEAGNIKLTIGTAELFERALFYITDSYDGYLAYKQTSLQSSIDTYETRIENMEAMLNRKMETMITRFVAMEMALSKINTQSEWLAAQIGASFYNYMLRRITEGDVKGDMKAFDEVILMLGQLESAWKEIFHASEAPRFIHDHDTGHENPAPLRVMAS